MRIISISGLDGSGKSTQIELLKNHLESQGKKVLYFHAVQFSIANRKKSGSTEPKSVTNASWLQIQLRKIALLVDLIRFKSFIKNLSAQKYDYLLSDRYFYDNIINIAYLSKQETVSFYPSITAPDYAFYLNTNPEAIMIRDRVPDQGINYLNKKKALLDLFSKDNNLKTIDGNREKEIIQEEIRKAIL
jgi:thymidylate kinase